MAKRPAAARKAADNQSPWPADAVERRPITSIVAYEKNARLHSPDQIKQIAASIKEFGFTIPVLVDENGVLIAGHGRLEGAKLLGLTELPVMTARGWTEAQIKAYRIADNQLTLNSDWSPELLKIEFDDLKALDFNLALTGFSPGEIDRIFDPDSGTPYSPKLDPLVYIPKGDQPAVSELFDEAKAIELRNEIAAANLPDEVAKFLERAADRHTVFDFHRIADYYASAPAPVQRLMEKSALVIIDFNAAIEFGFVRINDRLRELAKRSPVAADA